MAPRNLHVAAKQRVFHDGDKRGVLRVVLRLQLGQLRHEPMDRVQAFFEGKLSGGLTERLEDLGDAMIHRTKPLRVDS